MLPPLSVEAEDPSVGNRLRFVVGCPRSFFKSNLIAARNIRTDETLNISGFAGNAIQPLNDILFGGLHKADCQNLCVGLMIAILRSFFSIFDSITPFKRLGPVSRPRGGYCWEPVI